MSDKPEKDDGLFQLADLLEALANNEPGQTDVLLITKDKDGNTIKQVLLTECELLDIDTSNGIDTEQQHVWTKTPAEFWKDTAAAMKVPLSFILGDIYDNSGELGKIRNLTPEELERLRRLYGPPPRVEPKQEPILAPYQGIISEENQRVFNKYVAKQDEFLSKRDKEE